MHGHKTQITLLELGQFDTSQLVSLELKHDKLCQFQCCSLFKTKKSNTDSFEQECRFEEKV